MKKRNIFYDTLESIGENLLEAAQFFENGLKNPQTELGGFAVRMKEYESKGDSFTHTIVSELNKTFMPPLENEDILNLTTSLDDVLDGMEAAAARMHMYHTRDIDNFMIEFAENLTKSCGEIKTALQLLPTKKLIRLREHTMNINILENEADDLLRKSIRELFSDVPDPIELIKKKDIYEILEETTDYCEDVANIMETIIMANS